MIDVLATHVHAIPSLDVDSADPMDLAPPFMRPTAAPWLARGFLAAGHVTVLTGDAHAHGSPLALAWVASLASFRPHGAFVPFAPFCSVVDDRASYESEQRRRLAGFAVPWARQCWPTGSIRADFHGSGRAEVPPPPCSLLDQGLTPAGDRHRPAPGCRNAPTRECPLHDSLGHGGMTVN